MKRLLEITAVKSKASFHERMLEDFVQQNLPAKAHYSNRLSGMGDFNATYKEIESCAAETPVNGPVEIFYMADSMDESKCLRVLVSSRFFVFCTRNEMANYRVAWSCSLS